MGTSDIVPHSSANGLTSARSLVYLMIVLFLPEIYMLAWESNSTRDDLWSLFPTVTLHTIRLMACLGVTLLPSTCDFD